jgi:hypothetical protein
VLRQRRLEYKGIGLSGPPPRCLAVMVWMGDLFERETFARLPRPLAEDGTRRKTYGSGDLIDWSPGPELAIEGVNP